MIIVRFHGGLGNQMFEYTFYTYMMEKYADYLKGDITWFDRNKREHQGYELKDVFGIELDTATYKEIAEVHEYYPKYYPLKTFRYLSRKFAKRKNTNRNDKEKVSQSHIFDFGPTQYAKNDRFDSLDTLKDWYIEGVFCSDKYLECCEEKVKKAFTFKEALSAENQALAMKMKSENSVAVHIRRGDYVGSVFDILGIDYYKNAVSFIKEKLKNPVFYVFSDDMEYVKANFDFLGEYKEVHSNGKKSYEDMRMISLCNNAIIANSSFSYWGAVLIENKDAIIVAPKKYKADEEIALARSTWTLM